jgi:hypothetical protein
MKNIKNIMMLLEKYIKIIDESDNESFWKRFEKDSRQLYNLSEREEKDKEQAIKQAIFCIAEILESMRVLLK